MRYLALAIATLWVGGLWVTGVSANSIFKLVANRTLAGNIAGQLFTTISYIGMVSAAYLVTYLLFMHGKQAFKHALFWIVVMMLMLILFGQFGIQPWLAQLRTLALPSEVMQSDYARQFAAWHGVAGVLYLVECLLGLLLVWKIADLKH